MMRNVRKKSPTRTIKNSSIQRLTPKTWSLSEEISKRRALSPLILTKGVPRITMAWMASAMRRQGWIFLIVIFEHLVLRVLHFFLSLLRIVERNNNAEENDKGEAEDKICDALSIHYFFFPFIIRYRTTMAAVGIIVKAMVASIEMSMVSPCLSVLSYKISPNPSVKEGLITSLCLLGDPPGRGKGLSPDGERLGGIC
jgi:hypothetical protein